MKFLHGYRPFLCIIFVVKIVNGSNGVAGAYTRSAPVIGCSEQDHRSCDDTCKMDSFWYGYCANWDGRDLQCSCVAYKAPLEGKNVCGVKKQEQCFIECREKGQESGGYCAVFPSSDDRRGEPKCMCFDKPVLK